MHKNIALIFLILFVVTMLALSFNHSFLDVLTTRINTNSIGNATMFVFLLVVATVIAPLTVLPLIPVASLIFGALQTSLLSIAGWTIGAVISFLLARLFGKRALRLFISLEAIERLEEKIGSRAEFWYLVCLRMILPVDVLSYAFGFISKISFSSYFLATLIGVTPFSFIFAYGGSALFEKNFPALIAIALSGIIIFSVVSFIKKKAFE